MNKIMSLNYRTFLYSIFLILLSTTFFNTTVNATITESAPGFFEFDNEPLDLGPCTYYINGYIDINDGSYNLIVISYNCNKKYKFQGFVTYTPPSGGGTTGGSYTLSSVEAYEILPDETEVSIDPTTISDYVDIMDFSVFSVYE
ncbi:MAG: hypothetical protein R2800_03300 [Flavipsychrobacter sp.]